MLHKHNFIEILSWQEYRDDISFSTESQDGAQNVGSEFLFTMWWFFQSEEDLPKVRFSNLVFNTLSHNIFIKYYWMKNSEKMLKLKLNGWFSRGLRANYFLKSSFDSYKTLTTRIAPQARKKIWNNQISLNIFSHGNLLIAFDGTYHDIKILIFGLTWLKMLLLLVQMLLLQKLLLLLLQYFHLYYLTRCPWCPSWGSSCCSYNCFY